MRLWLCRAIGVLLSMCVAAAAPAETIRFGAIVPLSGADERTGRQQMRGIQIAVDEANAAGGIRGRTVEVRFEDNRTDVGQAVRSLVGMDVPVVFTAGPGLREMGPAAARAKVLLVNASDQDDGVRSAAPFLFSTIPSIGEDIDFVSRYLIRDGKNRGVILCEDTPAGIAARDDFVRYFPEAGGTILSQETIPLDGADYRPALLKLAAAGPDVMLVSLSSGLRTMVQQYNRLGLRFAVADVNLADRSAAGPGADPVAAGLVEPAMHIERKREPTVAFAENSGEHMEFAARQYYDATRMVLKAADDLLAEERPITGEAMRDRLAGSDDVLFDATSRLEIHVMTGGHDRIVGKPRGD
jgi:branched-chain amino acid transport system substrate-binding protein